MQSPSLHPQPPHRNQHHRRPRFPTHAAAQCRRPHSLHYPHRRRPIPFITYAAFAASPIHAVVHPHPRRTSIPNQRRRPIPQPHRSSTPFTTHAVASAYCTHAAASPIPTHDASPAPPTHSPPFFASHTAVASRLSPLRATSSVTPPLCCHLPVHLKQQQEPGSESQLEATPEICSCSVSKKNGKRKRERGNVTSYEEWQAKNVRPNTERLLEFIPTLAKKSRANNLQVPVWMVDNNNRRSVDAAILESPIYIQEGTNHQSDWRSMVTGI